MPRRRSPDTAPLPLDVAPSLLPAARPDAPQRRGRKASNGSKNGSSANLGFEATLWLAADKLRNTMDAAEYKHVVLGLIFLKYISDAFAERYRWLLE